MQTLNDRIGLLIDDLQITKTAFAEKLKVSQQYISKLIVKGTPSDRLIDDICEKFNVNEEWLRTGEGDIFRKLKYDDYIRAVTEIDISDPDARQAILLYWQLSDEDKKVFWRVAKQFIQNFNLNI